MVNGKLGLRALRDRNLDEATFEERVDIISKLGIGVYPSEDLKSMRVLCQLDFRQIQSSGQDAGTSIHVTESQADGESESDIACRKVLFGSPRRIPTRCNPVMSLAPSMSQ